MGLSWSICASSDNSKKQEESERSNPAAVAATSREGLNKGLWRSASVLGLSFFGHNVMTSDRS